MRHGLIDPDADDGVGGVAALRPSPPTTAMTGACSSAATPIPCPRNDVRVWVDAVVVVVAVVGFASFFSIVTSRRRCVKCDTPGESKCALVFCFFFGVSARRRSYRRRRRRRANGASQPTPGLAESEERPSSAASIIDRTAPRPTKVRHDRTDASIMRRAAAPFLVITRADGPR